MIITSRALQHGIFADEYGHRGQRDWSGEMVTYSLPIQITDAPADTVTFAIVFEDKDAVPVCGFTWIHWLVADLDRTELLANESVTATDFVQGTNSWSGKLGGLDRLAASYYGGMSPPDCAHVYELHVYALDTRLDLPRGFYLNELHKAMAGHVLDQATLMGLYPTR
ncbi:MAG: YbhB/YbcL family Raf kinase inhibitor-like protein [Eubacteriales bacterium]|nr:YbhB/YbcL family Raf kinase inhibitor-like protein [Eubacteriales bacterium]